jgi:hypothetical protein
MMYQDVLTFYKKANEFFPRILPSTEDLRTTFATYVAANKPRKLILGPPFYSLMS